MTEKARKSMSFMAVAAGPALRLPLPSGHDRRGAASRGVLAPASTPWPQSPSWPAPLPGTSRGPRCPGAGARQAPLAGIVLNGEDSEITSVMDGSPRSRPGSREDRIVEINGHKVEEAGDVVEEIRSLDPGDTVKLRVERDGDERTVTATLEGRPGPAPFARHFRTPRPFVWHHGDGDADVFVGGPSATSWGSRSIR